MDVEVKYFNENIIEWKFDLNSGIYLVTWRNRSVIIRATSEKKEWLSLLYSGNIQKQTAVHCYI